MNTTKNIIKHIDNGGNERELELIGTCKDGTDLFSEVGGTGVVGDNADGIRLFADLEQYLDALPDSDRAEVKSIISNE
jgi:hypothetical protein